MPKPGSEDSADASSKDNAHVGSEDSAHNHADSDNSCNPSPQGRVSHSKGCDSSS